MKVKSISGANFLIIGLVLFVVGLLMILHQSMAVNLFAQVIPDAQILAMVGIVVQFLGAISVVFGATRLVSSKLLASMQMERQALSASINQSMQRMQAERQTLMNGFNQTIERVDKLLAAQRTVFSSQATFVPSNCRFCGSRIESGRFCPKCGKAQS